MYEILEKLTPGTKVRLKIITHPEFSCRKCRFIFGTGHQPELLNDKIVTIVDTAINQEKPVVCPQCHEIKEEIFGLYEIDMIDGLDYSIVIPFTWIAEILPNEDSHSS